MFGFLLRRVFAVTLVLLSMSFAVFCLQTIVPADPARAIAGPTTPLTRVAELRKELGLNDPVIVQYGRFLIRVTRGDLGTSVRTRKPIAADVRTYLPASLELSIVALAFGAIFAAFFAVVPAIVRWAHPIGLAFTAAGSLPIFATSLFLSYLFWFRLGVLPGAGRMSDHNFSGPTGFNLVDSVLAGDVTAATDATRHIILPALALAFPIAIAVGRTLSSSLRDVMQQRYIETARGKGLSEASVVIRHALRNALPSALAMLALQVRLLFGNLLVVELVFGWPGLGLYMVHSLASADLPAVLGVTLVLSVFYLAVSLVIEVFQTALDPRIAG
ncbi:ABC transporter permease [Rhizobium sp. GCM10022189]|uniref:ABC transporter permease n=1 Tax=Rhizobium sp. GCM10022189 TaxID=3252654 RepID=UPI0036236EC4